MKIETPSEDPTSGHSTDEVLANAVRRAELSEQAYKDKVRAKAEAERERVLSDKRNRAKVPEAIDELFTALTTLSGVLHETDYAVPDVRGLQAPSLIKVPVHYDGSEWKRRSFIRRLFPGIDNMVNPWHLAKRAAWAVGHGTVHTPHMEIVNLYIEVGTGKPFIVDNTISYALPLTPETLKRASYSEVRTLTQDVKDVQKFVEDYRIVKTL